MNAGFADKNKWNAFVSAQSGSFLQSSQWAEFQEKIGRKVLFLGLENNAKQWNALVIKQPLPLAQNYLYIPRGPVFVDSISDILKEFLPNIQAAAGTEKSLFVRVDSFYRGDLSEALKSFNNLKFKDIGRTIQPKNNLAINLERSEEYLMGDMHEKTRYNIRLAQKHGVYIKSFTVEESEENKKIFWKLISKTTQRQNIRSYSQKYYDTMIDIFYEAEKQNRPGAFGRTYLAYYKGEPLGAAFVIFFGKRVTYLHGGTSMEHKNVMAPYLLHWEIMRSVKQDGFIEYDLGGIDEQRWPGITRFKKGFGGTIESYPNAIDLPLSDIKYSLYELSRKFL
ncbi:MAG: Methicillin resistance protein [Parcubacteria group bacterium GW2011_GWB1_40_14]|nr:MAG: Methicillin resistance protein [Parcubacteria group bacterium GW2011_GWB1_40_14]